MAFQLSHHWTHEQILTEYLNTIYFGNGALGIEAAARIYFGWNHGYDPANPAEGGKNACGDADAEHPHRKECASVLTPAEAALLAAMVANPTAFNPVRHPDRRRCAAAQPWCWRTCTHSTTSPTPVPDTRRDAAADRRRDPAARAAALGRAVLHQLGRAAGRACARARGPLTASRPSTRPYYGGLKIKLSIDLNLQNEAQAVINAELPASAGLPDAPRWSRSPTRPARSARWSAATATTSSHRSTSRRWATASRARRSRSSRSRPRSHSGKITPYYGVRLPPAHDPLREEGRQRVLRRQRHRPLPRAQLRQRLQRLDPDDGGDRDLGQQRVRAARH